MTWRKLGLISINTFLRPVFLPTPLRESETLQINSRPETAIANFRTILR